MKINGLRFIIGEKCNYDCFYCHHEGCYNLKEEVDLSSYEYKIKMLKKFCQKNDIKDIAITGGEPFLYFKKLKILLDTFDDGNFRITLNTNASLIHMYIDYLNSIKKIELHINLSSLDKKIHKQITNSNQLDNELKSLYKLKETPHIIKLNIIALKTINEDELVKIHEFSKKNNFIPRYLVLYDEFNKYKDFIMTIDEICDVFKTKVLDFYAYGLYRTSPPNDFEIVKCLCADNECDICKNNTYLHISPDLSIKYCLKKDDLVSVNYDSLNSMEESFKKANKLLKEINV